MTETNTPNVCTAGMAEATLAQNAAAEVNEVTSMARPACSYAYDNRTTSVSGDRPTARVAAANDS